MTLKEKLLKTFREQGDIPLSGQMLADQFGVSRAAVWKAIQALRAEGYHITASIQGGYQFATENDLLSAEAIRAFSKHPELPVYCFAEIDSTNNYARRLSPERPPHGTLIVADSQTAGRGRQHHSFYSPAHTGLYLSLILCPEHSEYLQRLTPAAAVASVQALREQSDLDVRIKWVNDLFVGKKKVGGILTEAITDFESGKIDMIIVGIGINCRTLDFPEELSAIAGSLNAPIDRSRLAASIRDHLLELAADLEGAPFMQEYRDLSLVIGKEIRYEQDHLPCSAWVKDINENGNLIIETPAHETEILSSGEISIKDWQ